MKVLQLTVHYAPNVGGVETHLSDLVNGLLDKKHNVFVLAYRPLMTKASWQIFQKKNNLQILRLPWLPGLFYKLVHKPLFEFIYLTPFLLFTTPFVIIKFNPEVIHAHGLIAGFVGVFWAKIFRKRVVVSTHSLYQFPKTGMYTNFVKFIFSNSDAVLCLSDKSVHEIVKLGVGREKVKRFTYWVDLRLFKNIKNAKKILGWQDKFICLFVGRLVPEKGLSELIAASKLINKNINIAIAGSGPMEEYVKENISSQLIYLGRVDQKKLHLYYSAADVVIVPSTHEEGFGRVIIESLACGTPVIASDRGSTREAMDESVGEFIKITPKNISKALNNFSNKDLQLKKMSILSRKFSEKNYSSKNILGITSVYK